ncbi:MAG TPA: helix-turn-helix domain-containing protein [Thermoanaerobaculia bacterium]|nr:helix-turn-helix domain-containing protein [Thermoanaerobaculia bacterium]
MRRNDYEPDAVSPPGATLLDLLEERGMSQAELANRTDRPLKTINEIVKGKAAITPETAIQLERVFGAPASFWNNREAQYREFLARRVHDAQLEKVAARIREVPTRAMEKLEWIPVEKTRAKKLERVLSFFGVASIDALENRRHDARFRQSSAFEANPIAVGAWLRKGHLDADQIHCAPFDETKFRQVLAKARRLCGEMPDDFAARLVQLCASAGVALVFVKELPGTHLSGAARWLSPTKALIQLSVRHGSDDHFWFTFFHEAAHLLKHARRKVYIDADGGIQNDEEAEANQFAADVLIPPAAWKGFVEARAFTKRSIRLFASQVTIAPGVVVGRLQHERRVAFSFAHDLKRKISF